ncbi:MAG: hypothetical protein ACOZNI_29720, partial [Myxococcota bacterium]
MLALLLAACAPDSPKAEAECEPRTFRPDADGDGFGDPAGAYEVCGEAAAGWVIDGTDCDDGDAAVHPGAD